MDLRSTFANLCGFYDTYADGHRRDATRIMDGYQNPRPARTTPPPQDHLKNYVQDSFDAFDDIFSIQDEVRNVYFWGHLKFRLGHQSLYAQHALTGQPLLPSVYLSGESDCKGYLESYAMSSDRRYIALVYKTWLKNNHFMDYRHLTVIWLIEDRMDFRRRMHAEPWAKVVFAHHSKSALFNSSSRSVVFSDEGRFLSPSGEIDPVSGTVRPLLDNLHSGNEDSEYTTCDSFYSSNGKELFISEKSMQGGYRTKRVSPFGLSPPTYYMWREEKQLVAVSPNGRYLVLEDISDLLRPIYLFDTRIKETIELPCPDSYVNWRTKYHFSEDETTLTAFCQSTVSRENIIDVLLWDNLVTKWGPRSHAKIKTDRFLNKFQILVHNGGKSALLVTRKRLIQRVELEDVILFPAASDVKDEYPYNFSSVSRDGRKCALVSYGEQRGQVQLFDLDLETVIRRLELEWSPCKPDLLTLGISPDLTVLVVNAQVFDLGDGDDRIASSFSIIDTVPEILKYRRSRDGVRKSPYCRLECSVSPCNSYVIYMSTGHLRELEIFPAELHMFRVDFKSKSSIKIDLALPKHLLSASASFHPTLPLIAISYVDTPKAEFENMKPQQPQSTLTTYQKWVESPQLKIAIFEMGSSYLQSVELPERLVPLIKK